MSRRTARLGIAAVALAAMTSTVRSAAADGPSAPPPTPPSAPTAPAITAEAKEQARMHFAAGVNLLQDPERPRYEEAYTEFRQAYELAKSPSILGNIGLCAMKLERDAEAIDAYTRYLAEMKDLDPSDRAQTERDILTLRAGLAKVTIETQPDGALIDDTRARARGESITNIYGPIAGKTELGLRRGHHVFKARFPGGGEVTWEADINGGESHVFERPPDVQRSANVETAARPAVMTRPIPPLAYATGIATGAFLLGGAVAGVLALTTHSRYNSANDGTNPTHAQDLRSSGQTLNVVSDVFFVGTVIGAAATAYLYLTRPTVPSTETTGIRVFPGGLSGRF
jgi:hypothetical protein